LIDFTLTWCLLFCEKDRKREKKRFLVSTNERSFDIHG
jgi:hypothetical protein